MNHRNVVLLLGRLAGDPELRYLPNGTPIANFAVAVNRATRQADGGFKDELDGFFDCELFGPQALALAETCQKGTEVQISGALRQNKFKTKGEARRTISRIEIHVDSIAPTLKVAKRHETEQPRHGVPAPQSN